MEDVTLALARGDERSPCDYEDGSQIHDADEECASERIRKPGKVRCLAKAARPGPDIVDGEAAVGAPAPSLAGEQRGSGG
jgi:hypothetical protein